MNGAALARRKAARDRLEILRKELADQEALVNAAWAEDWAAVSGDAMSATIAEKSGVDRTTVVRVLTWARHLEHIP